MLFSWFNNVKVKVTLEEAMKPHSFFNLDARWGGWPTSRPGRFTPQERDPVPIVQEADWAPGSVWTGAENFAPIRIRSPDRPGRSEYLYRLRYPGPWFINVRTSICILYGMSVMSVILRTAGGSLWQ
jgi:hypothetical protein